jgi:hypothetical protein
MKKPKLIKRGEVMEVQPTKSQPQAITIQKTVTSVRDWLNTRQQNTKQNARDAFASLFAPPQEPCTGC